MTFKTTSSKRRQLMLAVAGLIAASTLVTSPARAITSAEIKAKGKLVVGIQAANPPWGFVDSTTGQADGIDADMRAVSTASKPISSSTTTRLSAPPSGRALASTTWSKCSPPARSNPGPCSTARCWESSPHRAL